MMFSYEHGMYWMTEKLKLAQRVHLNHQDLRSDSPNWMMPLADSGLKTEGSEVAENIQICMTSLMA